VDAIYEPVGGGWTSKVAAQEDSETRVVLAMGIRRWLVLASCSMLFLTAGCQGLPGATAGSASTSSACTTSDVRAVVERFMDAFNRGDVAQLDPLVSDQLFAWYSTDAPGPRFNAEAKDRSTLMAYFAARHQQHEHLVLNSLDVTFTNDRAGGFTFSVTRSADDGLPPSRYDGKGEVQCAIRPISLAVWAMARRPWLPIDLLPEAAAVILLGATVGAILLWRRRSAQRRVHVGT
jgi:hypothetical protein